MTITDRLIAQVTLTVDVWHEAEPATFTPDAHEPAAEYLAVRDANVVDVQTHGDPRPLALISFAGFDDWDPDALVQAATASALREASDTDMARAPGPRTIEEPEELEPLAEDTVVLDARGRPALKGASGVWWYADGRPWEPELPVVVLHDPV